MTEQEENINLGKMVFDDNTQERNLGPVWDKPVPDRWLCFCPNFLLFWWSSLDAFREFTSQKLVTNQLFGLESCVVRQDTFYPHQDYEHLFHWLVLHKLENCVFFTIGSKLEHFNQSLTKFTFFINTLNRFMMLCISKLKISSLCKE